MTTFRTRLVISFRGSKRAGLEPVTATDPHGAGRAADNFLRRDPGR